MAAMPSATRASAAVLGPGGKIYVIGGEDDIGALAAVHVYDVTGDSWATETDLPVPVSDLAAVLDAAGRIVVIGGLDATGQPTADVFVTQDLDADLVAPSFWSVPETAVYADQPYNYQAGADGNPAPGYSLAGAPTGMTIDAISGLVSWIDGREYGRHGFAGLHH
jgi:hypothetical protein